MPSSGPSDIVWCPDNRMISFHGSRSIFVQYTQQMPRITNSWAIKKIVIDEIKKTSTSTAFDSTITQTHAYFLAWILKLDVVIKSICRNRSTWTRHSWPPPVYHCCFTEPWWHSNRRTINGVQCGEASIDKYHFRWNSVLEPELNVEYTTWLSAAEGAGQANLSRRLPSLW